MTSTQPRIFISYSRKDGETFGQDLRQRLIDIFGEDQIWRDRDKMEGGVGWWKQITDALETVAYMVLVATPEAMQSPIVRKEWRYARQQGVCVYPVQVPDLSIDFETLPRWMRDSHFYNLDKEWETFVNYLKAPCQAVRVPFYGVPDLPEHFVQRPDVFEAMKAQLLDESRDNPVAITTSLVGAGGFGKTTLAAALCHDDEVQTAFDEGVLWVTLGENPDLLRIINDLLLALTGERSSYETVHGAASAFAEKLTDNDILIVIDDIWNTAHAKPFLQGGERCARLLTSRFSNIALDHNAQQTDVDEMSTSESVDLLLAGIEPKPENRAPFAELAARLGEWALMLDVTNGTLRKRMSRGADLDAALKWVSKALDKRGVGGLKTGSNEAAIQVLDTSIEQIEAELRPRLYELAIFVDDADILLTSLMALWDADDFDSEEWVELFADLSFVKYDAEAGTIRIHDVVREVLETKLTDDTPLVEVHRRLIENYGIKAPRPEGEGFGVRALPDDYAWRNIAHHLSAADQHDTLRDLLLNFEFLQAKLNATEPNALIADCEVLPDDDRPVQLVKSALGISAHILNHSPEQLPVQLVARLIGHSDQQPEIASLLQHCQNLSHPDLFPIDQTFQPAGGALIRTLEGHTSEVIHVTLSDSYAVSASKDKTLKVWNWRTGDLLRTLEGHHNWVTSVSLSGAFAVSGSADGTLGIWNWQTGEHIRTIGGKSDTIWSISLSGEFAVASSDDNIMRVWNWQTGEHLHNLEGHTESVWAVALSNEFAVSASDDNTLRVWNWQTGEILHTLRGHKSTVRNVSLWGEYAISSSRDNTLRVWDWRKGKLLRVLHGITYWVNGVKLIGEFAICACSDRMLRVWNWRKRERLHKLEGHTESVWSVDLSDSYAISASTDGTLRVWNWEIGEPQMSNRTHTAPIRDLMLSDEFVGSASDDSTLCIWNWQTGGFRQILHGHTSSVCSVELSSSYAVSASSDNTLRVWNWQTGEHLRTLKGHVNSVLSVALSDACVVSASSDNTLRVWNWQTGEHLRTLKGHVGPVCSVALSSRYAVSASTDRTFRVWNWQTGDYIGMIEDDIPVNSNISISDSRLLFRSSDNTLRIWDWQTGRLLKTLEVHILWINYVMLSSEFAICASSDKTLRVWNWETGELLTTFYADAPLYSVAIADNFERIIAGDKQGNVHFLRPNAALLAILRGGEA